MGYFYVVLQCQVMVYYAFVIYADANQGCNGSVGQKDPKWIKCKNVIFCIYPNKNSPLHVGSLTEFCFILNILINS